MIITPGAGRSAFAVPVRAEHMFPCLGREDIPFGPRRVLSSGRGDYLSPPPPTPPPPRRRCQPFGGGKKGRGGGGLEVWPRCADVFFPLLPIAEMELHHPPLPLLLWERGRSGWGGARRASPPRTDVHWVARRPGFVPALLPVGGGRGEGGRERGRKAGGRGVAGCCPPCDRGAAETGNGERQRGVAARPAWVAGRPASGAPQFAAPVRVRFAGDAHALVVFVKRPLARARAWASAPCSRFAPPPPTTAIPPPPHAPCRRHPPFPFPWSRRPASAGGAGVVPSCVWVKGGGVCVGEVGGGGGGWW